MSKYIKIKMKDYQFDVNSTDLSFVTSDRFGRVGASVEIEEEKRTSLADLIFYILEYTDRYWSFCPETRELETSPGRWRSVTDIWRHAKRYKPEVSLKEIMEEMFKMQTETECFVGHYCGTIYRRVFALDKNRAGCNFLGKDRRDEFDLTFYDWETITSEYLD